MIVSLILAAARNGVIGKNGKLPWHLPGELAFFKKTTFGHPLIMGRKTHESIGRALPGRQNIVITHDPGYKAEGCDVVGSLEQAIAAAKDTEAVFVIGGASVFTEALPKADRVYLTIVDADVEGDRFFQFDRNGWHQIFSQKNAADASNEYGYELTVWERTT